MALEIGSKIGFYEITSRLGEGGMGVVFRAHDTKLGRDVAIKALPEAFAADRERLQRFQREAQVLASLNHPNIAQIYGLEDSSLPPCIVMELVQGETLADRVRRGPIPVNEALQIAKQIAEALESAHEKGIVHRDLKPGNVMALPDGAIKVLDFGLAKVHEGPNASAGLSNSPTMMSASMPGSILGTAAYMAPEQAKGLNADARSDLFSFGCILYEMLTGRATFEGDSVSEVLASVLKTEPDLTLLPPNVNAGVRKLLRRCLEKNPKNRWHATADVRLELQSLIAGSESLEESRTAPAFALWRRAIPVALGMVLAAAVGGITVWKSRPISPRLPVVRLSVTVPDNTTLNFVNKGIAISPDGTQIVYQVNRQLYLRSIAELEGKPIPGTEDLIAATSPTFSPAGDSIVYMTYSDRSLRKISTGGGASVVLAKVDPLGLAGIEWTLDGILFGQGLKEIVRISENGGEQKSLIKANGSELIGWPQMLPGGKAILFSTTPIIGRAKPAEIVVQMLGSSERKVLMSQNVEVGEAAGARYLPTGHIVFFRSGVLFAVPFDLGRLQMGPNPVPVVQGVRNATGLDPMFSVSDTGSLLYVPGPVSSSIDRSIFALADKEGALERVKLPAGPYQTPRISPDGKRVAYCVEDGKEANIWVYDLSRGGSPSRLTFGGRNRFPVWSPKGDRIAFQSDREGDFAIFSQRVDGDGQPERLTKPEKGIEHAPESWGPIGDTVLFRASRSGDESGFSLWMLSILSIDDKNDKKPAPFGGVQSAIPTYAAFSRDGRWVAYDQREPGKNSEVYVQPFPATGAKYQLPLSRDNHHPAWSSDGKELFYIPGPGEFASIAVSTAPALRLAVRCR